MGSAGAFKPKSLNAPKAQDYSKKKDLSAFFNKDYVAATNKYEKENPDVPIERLENARKNYVKNTGGKLRDVTTAKTYQNLSESSKAKYRKRNPQDFKKEDKKNAGFKLGKTSLLGK